MPWKERPKLDPVLRSLGLRIRELREKARMTQEKAAADLRMAPSNYANIEQGRRNVTVNTLRKIAALFGVPIRTLFDEPRDRIVRPGRPRRDR